MSRRRAIRSEVFSEVGTDMGFLDKAKEAAASAMAQGQAKVGAYQQGRNETELYRALGEAFYREQRQGGDRDAVTGALSALDSHFAQVAAAAAAAPAANASAAETSTAETSTAETSTAGT